MRAFRLACLTAFLMTPPILAVPVASEPLRGTVFLADGKPAAGAIVWAAKMVNGPYKSVEAIADVNGHYLLHLAPGTWYVRARNGGQGGEIPRPYGQIQISAEQAPEAIDIRLEERGYFRGRFIEAETGKPIAGGKLYLDAALILTTDAKGQFEVGGLTRTNHEAFVVANGRIRMRVLFDTTARAETELEVPVPRAGKIVGRVTDEDGKPIAGAYVGRHTSGTYFSINGLFTPCDAEGRFEYDDVVPPDQPTRLSAEAPGFIDEERSGVSPQPDGKPLELIFRLRRKSPETLKGKDDKRRIVSGVVLGPNAAPMKDVLVRCGYQPNTDAIQMRSDERGRFRLTAPDEAGMLAVLPRGYQPEFPKVESGGNKEVVVRLRAGNTVRGQVVDDAGKPIKDVNVIASIGSPDPRLANPFWLSEASVNTDRDGKFTLIGIPEGARFDFLKKGLSDIRFRELKSNDDENKIVMQFGGAIKARVIDQNGKPIRNFRVLVAFPRARRQGEKTEGFFAGYSGIGVRFTSPDGSFVLTGVGAGSVYRIKVLAVGHGEAVEDRLIAVPTNKLETTEATLLKAGPPVSLRVRAVTADGKPIADARITLVDDDTRLDQIFMWGYDDASWSNMVRARTGPNGWADFKALGFSGATALAQMPGYAREHIPWRNRQKELTVKMTPECVLLGEIRDATGQPVKECYVNLDSGRDRIGVTIGPDDKGKFRIAELPAGRWEVVIRGTDGLTMLHQEQVVLSAGEKTELKIETKGK